jgi:hypothetical protein
VSFQIWLLGLVCPLNILWRASRAFLLRRLRHLVLAPLYRVMLADFFVGDQLTSQVCTAAPHLTEATHCRRAVWRVGPLLLIMMMHLFSLPWRSTIHFNGAYLLLLPYFRPAIIALAVAD